VSTPAVIDAATELAPLPAGVVTFCMSDIEASTRLWELDPDSMLKALVRHTERIAEAVEAHGGRLLRQKGEGDSTLSVFTDPVAAVRAAIAAMNALDDEPSVNGYPIRTRVPRHRPPHAVHQSAPSAQWTDCDRRPSRLLRRDQRRC
jgi:class 3 adenylate cyclase